MSVITADSLPVVEFNCSHGNVMMFTSFLQIKCLVGASWAIPGGNRASVRARSEREEEQADPPGAGGVEWVLIESPFCLGLS